MVELKYEGKILRKNPALASHVDGLVALLEETGARITLKEEKEIRNELLFPKNASKHFSNRTEATVNFEPKNEAHRIICRAIKNYSAAIDMAEQDPKIIGFK